jgi:TRAP-type mannitol/chloroaromatic compound transport system permease large subunit
LTWVAAHLAPLMFGALALFLLTGVPVAFALAACGMTFGFIGIQLGVLPEALLQALPLRMFGIVSNTTLLAIPFFTFIGLILQRSGISEDLLETIGQVFGPVRGVGSRWPWCSSAHCSRPPLALSLPRSSRWA